MKPLVISTWEHGLDANKKAYELLSEGRNSLDSVEEGLIVTENDPKVLSVGYGGLPDSEGRVTLDAAIMDWKARIGSVICVEHIKNPIKLARLVLENTEHTILAGGGAYKFAVENGFKPEILLTEYSLRRYKEWKLSDGKYSEEIHTKDFSLNKSSDYSDSNDAENHDTIGMIALDKYGNISAGCTTSGLAWKLHGRVGDSPIIGSGLYVDGETGAACSTGRGEECIRACGSFYIVQLMADGASPEDACRLACERVYKLNLLSSKNRDHIYQVGFLAVNKNGDYGAYSVRNGFEFALMTGEKNELLKSKYLIDEKYIIEDL
jgi:N4-(beta-N-acetylglucosaminyl)-L-asparaginase